MKILKKKLLDHCHCLIEYKIRIKILRKNEFGNRHDSKSAECTAQ